MKSEAARYPLDLHFAVARKVYELCQKPDGTEIRVTSPQGTDVTAEVWRGKAGHMSTEIKGAAPSDFAIFPPGCFGFTPKMVNGKAVFSSYTGFGKLSKPIEFEIKNQYVVDISGGWEAEELKRRIEGVKDGNFICEIMFGLNPKAKVDMNILPLSLEAERSPRTLHMGMGDTVMVLGPKHVVGISDKRWPGKGKSLHQDEFMMYPTLKVGGETVLKNGHLTVLDDPEIIEIAGQFGEPERVLAYTPLT